MAGSHSQWKALSFEKKVALVGAPLLVAVVTGLVITPLASLVTGRESTRLEVVDLVAKDSPPGLIDEPYIPPSVEVLVRNTGDEVSVVSGATFTVLDYGYLGKCEAGGGLDVSASYDVVLPTGSEAVGERILVDVSQEIRTGEADRFAFALTVPPEQMDAAIHLYRLRISLERDGGETVDAGVAIISVPLVVDDWSFDEEGEAFSECYRDNAATYERFSSLEGTRSPGMVAPQIH